MLLDILELYFDRLGYEVFPHQSPLVCIFNGSAGSCKSLSSCADLMISDFRMLRITGLELFQLQEQTGCKADRKRKAIMSGHANGALLKQCNDSGYGFFKKPFNFSKLDRWVGECEKNFDLSRPLGGKKPDKRYAFRRNIEYCFNASCRYEKFIGSTVDKSINGLGLRVFNPLYAGQEITILNGLEAPNLKGTVVWCNKVGERAYRAGLLLRQRFGELINQN